MDIKIDAKIKNKYVSTTTQIEAFLKPAESLTEEEARSIIKRYVAVFEGNFISWMSGASVSSRSVLSRYAADSNLVDELKYDHQSMLRNFAISCKAEPATEDYQYMYDTTQGIRKMVSELSGLKNICLMGTLENTSAIFIPYLAELGKKLSSADFTYTDVHGEADIEHANQFVEAISDEQAHGYVNSEDEIDEIIEQTVTLLKKIFT